MDEERLRLALKMIKNASYGEMLREGNTKRAILRDKGYTEEEINEILNTPGIVYPEYINDLRNQIPATNSEMKDTDIVYKFDATPPQQYSFVPTFVRDERSRRQKNSEFRKDVDERRLLHVEALFNKLKEKYPDHEIIIHIEQFLALWKRRYIYIKLPKEYPEQLRMGHRLKLVEIALREAEDGFGVIIPYEESYRQESRKFAENFFKW